jgi:hypothetical protein
MSKKVPVTCSYCRRITSKYPYQVKEGKKFFCNTKCKKEFHLKNRVEVICEYCGKPKYVSKKNLDTQKHFFCNNDHQWKWRREVGECIGSSHYAYKGTESVICEGCKKEFVITKTRYNSNKTNIFFCSNECMYKFNSDKLKQQTGDKHPNFKRIKAKCDNCQKDIFIKNKERDYKNHFCNNDCFHEYLEKNKTTILVYCEICKKEKIVSRFYYDRSDSKKFYCLEHWRKHAKGNNHYAWKGYIGINCHKCEDPLTIKKADYDTSQTKRFFCSKECRYSWHSETFRGKNHHNWNSEEVECLSCEKRIFRIKSEIDLYDKLFCSLSCRDEFSRGERHHCWLGGLSFEPYSSEFNYDLKLRIRERDDFTCILCGCKEEENGKALDCHHIDYDKLNSTEENIISLCRKNGCHAKTNFNRPYWTKHFQELLSEKYGYNYKYNEVKKKKKGLIF